MAMIYDGFLGLGLVFVYTLSVVVALGDEVAAGTLWFPVTLIALLFGFFGWCWTHGGQTLGMRAWRLKLINANGSPLDWVAALKHYAVCWLALLPALLGLWWVWLDSHGRTLQERMAGTRTVLLPKN